MVGEHDDEEDDEDDGSYGGVEGRGVWACPGALPNIEKEEACGDNKVDHGQFSRDEISGEERSKEGIEEYG